MNAIVTTGGGSLGRRVVDSELSGIRRRKRRRKNLSESTQIWVARWRSSIILTVLFFLSSPKQGEDNDHDKYHVAYSWVVVKLRDINDNKPQFERPNIEVSVYENVEVGKSLETFKATDPDQGGKSKVSYAIDRASDRRRQFRISQEGTVSIQRQLDREETPRHQVRYFRTYRDPKTAAQKREKK